MRSQRALKERLVALGQGIDLRQGVTLQRMLIYAHVPPGWQRRHLSDGEQDRLDRAFNAYDAGLLLGRVKATDGCWIRHPVKRRMPPGPPPRPRLGIDWLDRLNPLKWR